MAIKIVRLEDDWVLVTASRAMVLQIHCRGQLKHYLSNLENLNGYIQLVQGFHAPQPNFEELLAQLNRYYALNRQAVFQPQEFADVLHDHVQSIRQTPDFGPNNIDVILNAYEGFEASFRRALNRAERLPDISLSKLLHTVKPTSFWIVDSYVERILDISGYRTEDTSLFQAFGNALRDLYADPDALSLVEFLRAEHAALIGDRNPGLAQQQVSILKLLDEIFWYK